MDDTGPPRPGGRPPRHGRRRGEPPSPTVGRAGRQAALALHTVAAWLWVTGLCGGFALEVNARLPAAAAILAGTCTAGALALHAAGITAAIRARRLSLNPAAAIPAIALAAAAAWLFLPPWARYPAEAAAAVATAAAAKTGLRHRRRRALVHRIAQAISTEITQSSGDVAQVLGGLAGTLDASRVTAPHFGPAPGAAWSLRATRWDGDRLLEAVLLLPATPDIGSPDFLTGLRTALAARVGLNRVKMTVRPLRDEIILDFDPPPDPPAAAAGRRETAENRARAAVAQALRQKDADVTVTVEDWDDDSEPAGAPPAWPMRRFAVRYAQTPKVTSEASRELLRAHVSLQLHGEESALRADWDLAADTVTFTRRPEFPARITHRPVDIPAAFGNVVVIPHATDEDGNLVGWQWTETDAPHELMSGPTGTGKSVDLRTVMIEAARQGHEIRGIDPKRIEMRGLRGWPGVTTIATRVPEMIAVIDRTFDDMMDRYDAIERGAAKAAEFRMIGLFIDEYIMFSMLVNDWWADQPDTPGKSREHPVFRKVTALLVLARGAGIRVRIASQRTDATLFSDRALGGARDNLAARVALGRQTRESAQMMFGDATVGRDIPVGAVAVGTILGPAGLVRAKMHWLPDPADWDTLDPPDRQLLLDMLPPGTHWNGPQPWQPPADAAQAAPDPARRLLFFTRTALRTGAAYLTDAATGGPPAHGDAAAWHGWSRDPAGKPRHTGTWIGCIAAGPDGPRAYLHPERVMTVARRLAAGLDIPFAYARSDLDMALHASGLLLTEETPSGQVRWTVRRQLPGNDLGLRDDRQRVWDIPAAEILDGVPGSEPPDDPPPWDEETPPGTREARLLHDGDRITVTADDGTEITATILFTEPDDNGAIVIDYAPDNGTAPGTLRAQPGQPVRLAPPPAPGSP